MASQSGTRYEDRTIQRSAAGAGAIAAAQVNNPVATSYGVSIQPNKTGFWPIFYKNKTDFGQFDKKTRPVLDRFY